MLTTSAKTAVNNEVSINEKGILRGNYEALITGGADFLDGLMCAVKP
jgi:hypothetical protein